MGVGGRGGVARVVVGVWGRVVAGPKSSFDMIFGMRFAIFIFN